MGQIAIISEILAHHGVFILGMSFGMIVMGLIVLAAIWSEG